MALRNQLLIVLLALLSSRVGNAAIRCYPLDDRSVYSISIDRDAPTTCLFPGPLTALEGAGISTKIEDGPNVLLSYQAGTEFFSVRALKEGATAALNIVFQQKVYVLSFTSGKEPDRAVTFLSEPFTGSAHPPASVFKALVERAKQYTRIQLQYPALASTLSHAEPATAVEYPTFRAVIEAVDRFDAEDALVFRVRLENPGEVPVPYLPDNIAIRVHDELFPAAYVEASGAIPPRAASRIFVAIAHSPGGGRNNLSVSETYSVILPATP